jgi:Glycine zipper 2TM domain
MMNKFLSAAVAGSVMVAGLMSAAPAAARGDHHYRGHSYGYDNGYRGYDDRRGYNRRGYDRGRNAYRGDRCDKGTGGLIIGAIAGGLLGNEIVGRRGDRTAGTIIGAGVGALAGRAIDKSDGRRC